MIVLHCLRQVAMVGRKCAVLSCSRKEVDKQNPIRFFAVSTIINHQGQEMKELTNRRRVFWLKRLNLATNSHNKLLVRDAHFITGTHEQFLTKFTLY